MTRAEFDARYRLVEQIADDGVRSYRAHDLGTRREVTVHLFADVPAERSERLRALMGRLDARDRLLVLADSDVEGVPVVITETLPGFAGFADWLESRTSDPSGGRAEAGLPGEFTRLFGAALPDPSAAEHLGVPPPAGLASPEVSPAAESEFTRLFKPAEPAPGPRPVIRLGGTSPPPTPASPPPYQLPDLSQPPQERPLFATGAGASATGAVRPVPRQELDAPQSASAAARNPGEIADLIAAARGGGRASSPAPGARERQDDRSPSPEASGQPAGSRSYLPLILFLAFLLIAAVGLVLYFALKTS